MSTKAHYQNHLSPIYAWMVGDFQKRVKEQLQFFESNEIGPQGTKKAVDLGCGHGIQSIALGQLGYEVVAIDFDQGLLKHLDDQKGDLPIETHQSELQDFPALVDNPELIVCMGDTLAHLVSGDALDKLIIESYQSLAPAGKLILSYRDYGHALEDTQRFIPVRADDERILTCILEYEKDRVRVTDLLQERTVNGWQQKASSYYKLRIRAKLVEFCVQEAGFDINLHQNIGRMLHMIAQKPI
ncbi:MAG: class I SAM-dependent methyltransferase [Cyclobacteriaceae bacterium]